MLFENDLVYLYCINILYDNVNKIGYFEKLLIIKNDRYQLIHSIKDVTVVSSFLIKPSDETGFREQCRIWITY